jgi:hypothetical protein
LFGNRVPVGVPERDDDNGDGWINFYGKDTDGDGTPEEKEGASPLTDLSYPVWYFVGGGFGAPFYAEEPTPWNQYWNRRGGREEYYYSSQANILIFSVEGSKISVQVLNPYLEEIDRVDDLTKAKRRR